MTTKTDMTIHIGIIGCGGTATKKHMPALKKSPALKWSHSGISSQNDRKIRKGVRPPTRMMLDMKVMEAAFKSAELGQVIKF